MYIWAVNQCQDITAYLRKKHNLMCPEDGSRRDMRTEINRYMRTVFCEEPLDPTLEDFDDSQNW